MWCRKTITEFTAFGANDIIRRMVIIASWSVATSSWTPTKYRQSKQVLYQQTRRSRWAITKALCMLANYSYSYSTDWAVTCHFSVNYFNTFILQMLTRISTMFVYNETNMIWNFVGNATDSKRRALTSWKSKRELKEPAVAREVCLKTRNH